MALCTEQGFALYRARGTILQGWAMAEQGQGVAGLAQMRQGLVAYQATGAAVFRPYYLAFLAEAYGKVGQAEEGLTLLGEALAAVHKTGRAVLRGGALPAQRGVTVGVLCREPWEAETCFQQALTVARRQQAKSWELRAATSLSLSGSTRASALQPMTCSPQSTAGSPRALIQLTFRRLRLC